MVVLDNKYPYYLAGPISGYPDHNFPAFHAAAKYLRETFGISLVCPAEINLTNMDKTDLWESAMISDLSEGIHCRGGIILLSGWPQSTGARVELGLFLGLGRSVYYLDKEFVLHDMNKVI